jgi:hypothetical protein
LVALGADVVVIAQTVDGAVHTAAVARIDRARVAVVTVEGAAGHAPPLRAVVALRAGLAVGAGRAVDRREPDAAASRCVADSHFAASEGTEMALAVARLPALVRVIGRAIAEVDFDLRDEVRFDFRAHVLGQPTATRRGVSARPEHPRQDHPSDYSVQVDPAKS